MSSPAASSTGRGGARARGRAESAADGRALGVLNRWSAPKRRTTSRRSSVSWTTTILLRHPRHGEAIRLATIAVMDNGKLLQFASPAEILVRPRDAIRWRTDRRRGPAFPPAVARNGGRGGRTRGGGRRGRSRPALICAMCLPSCCGRVASRPRSPIVMACIIGRVGRWVRLIARAGMPKMRGWLASRPRRCCYACSLSLRSSLFSC